MLLEAVQAIRGHLSQISERLTRLEEERRPAAGSRQNEDAGPRARLSELSGQAGQAVTAAPPVTVAPAMTAAWVPPSSSHTGTYYTPRFTHLSDNLISSVRMGNFVNLAEFLPRVDKFHNDTCVEASIAAGGSLRFHPRSNATLDNFYTWLSAWNVHELIGWATSQNCMQAYLNIDC